MSARTRPPRLPPETMSLLARQVRRFCPPWMRHQLDDLVQMAVMRVLRAGTTIEHAPAYLRQVARSTVLDEVGRLRYRTEVGMTSSLPDRIVSSLELTPETVVHGHQLGIQLDEALATLSEDRRVAVTLFLQSQTVPEIAELLNCNRKRAANLEYRGMDDLRKELRRRGLTPGR